MTSITSTSAGSARPACLCSRARSLQVLFLVTLVGTAPAAYAGPFGFTRIVNSFNTTPPSEPITEKYDYVGIPAMSGSRIAFGAKLLGPAIGGTGLYTRIDTGTTAGVLTNYAKAATSPGPNPPNGTIAFFFDDPALSGSQVAARPSAYDGTNYRGQTFTYAVPNVPVNVGYSYGAPALYAGSTAFVANKVGINITQVQGTLVDVNDFVPGGGGAKFQTFSPYGGSYDSYLDYNVAYAAFLGRWVDAGSVSRTGVYRWQQSTDTIVAVADKNIPIPGFPLDRFDDNFSFATTNFDNVSTTGVTSSARPSLAGSIVAFSYDEVFSAPPRAGVYRYAGSSLTKIADVTTLNPSLVNTTFRHFEGVSTVGSATAFVANSVNSINPSLSASSIGSGYGIYLDSCGMLREVIREGQPLDGRIVSNLELGHRGLTTAKFSYNLAFRAEFTDGTEGIYVTSTSSLCFDLVSVLAENANLFASSTALVVPNPDIGIPIESNWQMRTINGPAEIPAVMGADFEQNLIGVNGLPGNNPVLIDFTLDNGVVAPEELVLSFDQDMILEGLSLAQFDPGDSLQLTIGTLTRIVDSADIHDGFLPLADIRLNAGESLHIAWDGTNATGDGFSFNGFGYHVVPEPSTLALLGIGSIVLLSYIGRRRPQATILETCRT